VGWGAWINFHNCGFPEIIKDLIADMKYIQLDVSISSTPPQGDMTVSVCLTLQSN
jgi:hypothetical protein